MTDDNVSKLPEPGVVLDLDSLQRPAKDVKEPFKVKVGGKVITFADPAEIDWRDLAAVQIPPDLFRVALSREDREHISQQSLEGWRFNELMKGYYTHYDFEEKVADAKRQAALMG